jgi:hypothetical protein
MEKRNKLTKSILLETGLFKEDDDIDEYPGYFHTPVYNSLVARGPGHDDYFTVYEERGGKAIRVTYRKIIFYHDSLETGGHLLLILEVPKDIWVHVDEDMVRFWRPTGGREFKIKHTLEKGNYYDLRHNIGSFEPGALKNIEWR